VQRLFGGFARGLPAIGILVLRLSVGLFVVMNGISRLSVTTSSEAVCLEGLLSLAALLLTVGLATPVAGSLIVAVEVWHLVRGSDGGAADVLIATIAGAVALIGPGVWSIDARLFGWKRLEIPIRKVQL
jgi:putative oxidoreductase